MTHPSTESAQIPEMVREAAARMDRKISPKEEGIISQLVASAPKDLTMGNLTVWCHRTVDPQLALYPDLQEKAEIITTEVRKELLYRINRQKFEEFKLAVSKIKPKVLNTNFIRENFRRFHEHLKRYRDLDGYI